MRLLPAGAQAVLIELDGLDAVQTLLAAVTSQPPAGLCEVIPAACTLMLRFDPRQTTAAELGMAVAASLAALPPGHLRDGGGPRHDITVSYDGEDLAEVAAHMGLSVAAVIRAHSAAEWRVAFTGFAPGFAYLVCDDPGFDLPRRPAPRPRIPAGSVALAGRFSGIYPSDSPGGWQLIGRTDTRMWDLSRPRPAFLLPGDRVRFRDSRRGASLQPGALPPAAALPAAPASGLPALRILRSDRPVTLQDGGRPGLAAQGIGAAGAMDPVALAAANAALGNPAMLPALEVTLGGLQIEADRPLTMALTGAPAPLTIIACDGSRHGVPQGMAFALDAGDRLQLDMPPAGLRSYLALRGGYLVQPVLGSASWDSLARIGPPPLGSGDRLQAADLPARAVQAIPPPLPALPRAGNCVRLRLCLGPREDWFTAAALQALVAQDWLVTDQASRIGLRLHGDVPLRHRNPGRELPSEAVVRGALQVPHDGQPVLFLADHPLTGGYPVIACLDPRDLPLAGQIPPGARLRFELMPAPPQGSRP